jgi:putative ABC transport system permease protein
MRPRAPKHGRRILLEQVSLIWNRLNFSQKVTCRNLFRYKKKLFMTILGVAGCTALVFTGFGLKDSIRMMVPLQYDEIQKFDFAVYLKNTVSQQQKTQLDGVLTADSNVKKFRLIPSGGNRRQSKRLISVRLSDCYGRPRQIQGIHCAARQKGQNAR